MGGSLVILWLPTCGKPNVVKSKGKLDPNGEMDVFISRVIITHISLFAYLISILITKRRLMFNKKVFPFVVLALLSGCASVPMETSQRASEVKQYQAPAEGKAGLYIYRYGSFGSALKKDVWIDGDCIGETARNVFFYEEVAGDQEHKISTESEFSPNDLLLKTESGKHYFIQQYIKFGAFVGGAGLKVVEETEAKKQLQDLGLATKGNCSQAKTTTENL